MFWINETKFSTKSEGLGADNYIGFHVWTLALGGIQHGDKIGNTCLTVGILWNSKILK